MTISVDIEEKDLMKLVSLYRLSYVIKAQQRKGGYCGLVRNMVIEASLMKGEFTDSFLWAMQ